MVFLVDLFKLTADVAVCYNHIEQRLEGLLVLLRLARLLSLSNRLQELEHLDNGRLEFQIGVGSEGTLSLLL